MSTNPITIEALEILDAIDRRNSFAKAAEELNKATSALSYGVQKLEEQLNITLFQRQGRRSVLTPAGRVVLEEGRKILLATTQLADKAQEVATGWEPRLAIAIESILHNPTFFQVLADFLAEQPNLEIDLCESVLNGGWEALEHDRVALAVGVSGPVPLQKGFRAVPLGQADMVPVIAAHHPLAGLAHDTERLTQALPELRRIINHDTSVINVVRSAGLSDNSHRRLYVQSIDQKLSALLAGLGIGHMPRHRIQAYLDNGQLLPLALSSPATELFIAWKISNKGKALQALATRLSALHWS